MSADEKWRAAVQLNINAAKNLGEDTPMVVPIRRDRLNALDTKQLIDFLRV